MGIGIPTLVRRVYFSNIEKFLSLSIVLFYFFHSLHTELLTLKESAIEWTNVSELTTRLVTGQFEVQFAKHLSGQSSPFVPMCQAWQSEWGRESPKIANCFWWPILLYAHSHWKVCSPFCWELLSAHSLCFIAFILIFLRAQYRALCSLILQYISRSLSAGNMIQSAVHRFNSLLYHSYSTGLFLFKFTSRWMGTHSPVERENGRT